MNRAAEDLNPFHIAQEQFDRALPHLAKLKHGLIDFLKSPIRAVTLNFPVEMDDGQVCTFTGYRVLHSRMRGPGKGGIRYHPDVTEDEVRALAGWMTWKTALPDILANSGGVCVSYFEWVQNIENEQWDMEEVNGKLLKKMRRAVDAVVDRWQQLGGLNKTDLRTAALVVAIDRVARVALERGIWP